MSRSCGERASSPQAAYHSLPPEGESSLAPLRLLSPQSLTTLWGPLLGTRRRNQQLLPRACVEHILTDLRDNGSRQIGIDPREHDAGDHRPGFDFKRLPRRPRVRQNPSRIPRRRAIKKSLLVFVGGGIVAVIAQSEFLLLDESASPEYYGCRFFWPHIHL